MKQFLTLCLATAMLGTSVNVDAKISLKRAMELKGEGKAITMPVKTRNHNAPKNLHHKPASRFHKLMADKSADKEARLKKVPGKVVANGDNIYGYLGFTYEEDVPYGLYEFREGAQDLKWAEEYGLTVSSLSLDGNVLKGFGADASWGMVYGAYYMEYDFETGEVLDYQEVDLNESITFLTLSALDLEEGMFYGYGYYDGEYAFLSAPADDPLNVTKIADAENPCFAFCYNPVDNKFYGILQDVNDFVEVDRNTGSATVLAHVDMKGLYPFTAGMVFDPISNLFYVNAQTQNEDSYLMTIDPTTYAWEIIDDFTYGDQWISLFTTDAKINPDQPKRPVAGAPEFYQASLTGTVSFTLPQLMGDDAEIKGDVEYMAYLDDELYTTGKASAGADVVIPFTVAEEGMHVFGMKAVVDGVESSMASVRCYVGNDTPLAPAGVAMTTEEITWEPVGFEGVHGGYVDAGKVEYDVYLNGKLLGTTAETKYALTKEDVNPDAQLSTYQALVVAKCNGYESTNGSSNVIVEGQPFKLPASFEPTPEQYTMSLTLDGNEDGETWTLKENEDGSYFINSGWNGSMALDEWFFLPPVQIDDVSKFYSFSMDVACASASYPDEYVEVLLCNEPSPNGVVETIIDEFMPVSSAYEEAFADFRVRQEGAYYIAIHATSDPDQMGVCAKNFKIEDRNITLDSPAEAEDLDLEPADEGKLTATATFTLPTENLAGDELPADADLKAFVSCANTVEVSGKPGEEVSVEVETYQGDCMVKVYVSYNGFNSPYASDIVYTGVVVPVSVDQESLKSEVSADHLSMTLSWAPVTEGEDGGYLNPATVVYDIYTPVLTIFGYQWDLYDQGITETTYTYTPEQQEFAQVGVVARNEAGDNGYLVYATAVVGPALNLPIAEDFEKEGFVNEPWVISSVGDAAEPMAEILNNSEILGEVGNESVSLVIYGDQGAIGELSSPYFSTVGHSSVVLDLEVSGDVDLPKVTVLAEGDGIDLEEIGEIVQTEAGFQKVAVSLPAKFLNNPYVGLRLHYEFEEGDEFLIIESISIDGATGVASISGSNVKVATGKNLIKVSGLKGENVTVSSIGGAVVAKTAKVSSEASFQVEKGIYIVEAGDKKTKVVVK